MSVTPRAAVDRLRERLSHRAAEDLEAEASAKALMPDFACVLREAGAKRVVLFGSLAGGLFRRNSDIDIAVAGLPEQVLARYEQDFSLRAGRTVELANIDLMPAALRDRIDSSGQELP